MFGAFYFADSYFADGPAGAAVPVPPAPTPAPAPPVFAGGGGGGPWRYVEEPKRKRKSKDECFVEALIANDFDVTAALVECEQTDWCREPL